MLNSTLQIFYLFSLLRLQYVSAQSSSCNSACSDYSQVLDSCTPEGSGNAYYSCVCSDSNFNSSITECLSCVGPNSPAAGVAKRCQTQAPNCNVACYEFSQILTGCGDTSTPGFHNCVCSASYDTTNTGVFNQQILSCVSCENGGGAAEYWEAYCCANGYGCKGASAQASSDAATISVASRTASTTTTTPSSTRSGNSAGTMVAGSLGAAVGQALLWGLL